MNLKKTLVLMLVLVFALGAITGCNSKKPEQQEPEVVVLETADLEEKLDEVNDLYDEVLALVEKQAVENEMIDGDDIDTNGETTESTEDETIEDAELVEGSDETTTDNNEVDVVETETEDAVETEDEVETEDATDELLEELIALRADIDEIQTKLDEELFEEQGEIDLAIVKVNSIIERLTEVKNELNTPKEVKMNITLVNKLEKEINKLDLMLNSETELLVSLINDEEALAVNEEIQVEITATTADLLFIKVETDGDSYTIMDVQLEDGLVFEIK